MIKSKISALSKLLLINKRDSSEIQVEEDNLDFVLNLDVLETLVREIYNIDVILDNVYKSKILEKTKSIIRIQLMNTLNLDCLESKILKERNNVINYFRKKGRNIISISSDSELQCLFSNKNKVHYLLYTFYKKKGKTKNQLFELLTFLLDGFDFNKLQYDSLDQLDKSIEYRYVIIKRKCVVIEFLKLIKDTKNLDVRII